ncbi:hypothetical protein Tco_0740204 [Tanacetum coccineum]
MILELVEHGPLIWPTIKENKVTRTKKYVKLSATEKLQADCDMKEINIILQGLPTEIYSLFNHHRVAKDLGGSWAPASGPLLTDSSLLAALIKAREDDERHQESRQDRPDQIMHQQVGAIQKILSISFSLFALPGHESTSFVGRKSNAIFALPGHRSTSSVGRKSNVIFALPDHGSTSSVSRKSNAIFAFSVGRKSNVIFAFPGHRSTSSVGRKLNVIFALPGHRSTSSVGCKSNAISGRKLKIDMAAYGWKVRTSPRR